MSLYGDDKLMVANDAGGLRMIDISDKENPLEIGKYANEMIEDTAQSAYNNVLIVDHYAYVPVDMCGLDVVNIEDAEMETVYWYNPWDCDVTNWVGRPGHTNEIKRYGENLIFVSGGDTEVLAFDITNREIPVLVGTYAHVPDSIVAWALDVKDNYVSLALVHSELGVPYYSNQGGVSILEMDITTAIDAYQPDNHSTPLIISPNPATDLLQISANFDWDHYEVMDMMGRKLLSGTYTASADIKNLQSSCYILLLYNSQHQLEGSGIFMKK
jgi:hypothetical protein